ncbi:polyketide cyclase / dehydrase and lipid transport domain-containing protein [Ditylenchus destructor]|nr:polyketide cyclase / dehydrase and lipid transport domain-containing protein [Ditylenchus destructor]
MMYKRFVIRLGNVVETFSAVTEANKGYSMPKHMGTGNSQASKSGDVICRTQGHWILCRTVGSSFSVIRVGPKILDFRMFDVVYTVADYPKFVPWCKGADVRKTSERAFDAELWIGFPPLQEHYSSRVTSLYPYVVNSYCTDGRLFHVLDTTWRFGPGPEGSPKQSCTLHFTLQFEFKSALNAQLSQMFFGQVVRKMVTAFLCRAEHCYGPPSLDHFKQQPEILTQQ